MKRMAAIEARTGRQSLRGATLAAFALAGCGTLLGVDAYHVRTGAASVDAGGVDAGGVDAGAHARPFRFTDSGCGRCMAAACGPSLAACLEDVACRPWQTCMSSCPLGDGACEHSCFVQAGRTNGAMGNVAVCESEHCLEECRASGFAAPTGATCAESTRTACSAQSQAIWVDPSARDEVRCLFARNCLGAGRVNPGCIGACGDLNGLYVPDATGASSPFMAATVCSYFATPDCGWGDFSCVGKYSWAAASQKSVQVTVYAGDGAYPEFPGNPLPNLDVRACGAGDVTCQGPLPNSHRTTDGTGRATFTLATEAGVAGFDWYFEVTPSPVVGPATLLFYAGRRLGADTFVPLATYPDAFKTLPAWNAEKSMLLLWSRDCQSGLSPNTEIRLDAGAGGDIVYHESGGAAHSTPSAATNYVFVTDVNPGVRTVSAWHDGVEIAREDIVARTGSATFVNWLYPKRNPGPGQ